MVHIYDVDKNASDICVRSSKFCNKIYCYYACDNCTCVCVVDENPAKYSIIVTFSYEIKGLIATFVYKAPKWIEKYLSLHSLRED